jgi:hypothetical protein
VTLESGPQGLQNVWVAQLDRDGKVNWAKSFQSEQLATNLGALTVDGLGNIALAGDNPSDINVRKLRPTGESVWLRSFPTSTLTELGIAADNDDENLWLAGSFRTTFDWGSDVTTTRGSIHAFLLRISP